MINLSSGVIYNPGYFRTDEMLNIVSFTSGVKRKPAKAFAAFCRGLISLCLLSSLLIASPQMANAQEEANYGNGAQTTENEPKRSKAYEEGRKVGKIIGYMLGIGVILFIGFAPIVVVTVILVKKFKSKKD